MALFEEVPDRGQMNGAIWVVTSESSDVPSSQDFREKWIQRLIGHVSCHLQPIQGLNFLTSHSNSVTIGDFGWNVQRFPSSGVAFLELLLSVIRLLR